MAHQLRCKCKRLCIVFQVTRHIARGTSNVSSHQDALSQSHFCEVHHLAKLKASAQELDMKHTWSNPAKVQNHSSQILSLHVIGPCISTGLQCVLTDHPNHWLHVLPLQVQRLTLPRIFSTRARKFKILWYESWFLISSLIYLQLQQFLDAFLDSGFCKEKNMGFFLVLEPPRLR